MLKKRLGIEAIEINWNMEFIEDYYKIPPSLIIPDGCRQIGYSAFSGCIRLREVIVPGNVEVIGDCAFDYCEKAIIILKKPQKEFRIIGLNAFAGCRDVKEEIRK